VAYSEILNVYEFLTTDEVTVAFIGHVSRESLVNLRKYSYMQTYFMYLGLIPLLLVLFLFIVFWITQEGSSWQKHRFLGPFARFIQASAGRAFATLFFLTIFMIPSILAVLQGMWTDMLNAGATPANTVPVVNSLLLMFLLLSGMIPVTWSAFRSWRHQVRSAADARVRASSV
jgi:hypothetical protein